MLRNLGRVLGIIGLLLVAGWLVARFIVASGLDNKMNVVIEHEPYPVSEEARALHADLRVADLHDDMLLWARNPLQRNHRGQTDFPRFRDGRAALQVFTAVTKAPSKLNLSENSADSHDDITTLAIAQGWPVDTWTSLEARARFQARRLHRLAGKDADFVVVLNKQDLADMLARRQDNPAEMGGILGIEGSHPLEGDIKAVDRLYNEGYRLMGLQHFFDNELGGSLHGVSKGGLTEFGRKAVDRMEEKHIVIDVAHSSEQVVRDVLARTTRPILVSHTGIKSLCDTGRNIDDELMQQIADRGGLIGIGFWEAAVCDASPDGVASTIVKAVKLFGEDAIALGSDFDGAVTTEFDYSENAALTDALLRQGLTEGQIRKVMGENEIRYFAEWLPE